MCTKFLLDGLCLMASGLVGYARCVVDCVVQAVMQAGSAGASAEKAVKSTAAKTPMVSHSKLYLHHLGTMS